MGQGRAGAGVPGGSGGPGGYRPLLVARDEDIVDDVLRLGAAAGCELDRALDAGAARAAWRTAPVVLVDAAALAGCSAARLPRRDGVIVVCRGAPGGADWQAAVAVGVDEVVCLPDAEAWLIGVLADAVEPPAAGGGVIAVLGGRGGAGASVFATALAVTAARWRGAATLVDCDPLGGGVDLLLGAEETDGLRWPGLWASGGRVNAASLHRALPTVAVSGGEVSVLSCARDLPAADEQPRADAVASVLAAGRRAGRIVVCDLPRHLPPSSAAVLAAAHLVVLVVPAEVRACAAARSVAAAVLPHGVALRIVVRGPAPGGLTSAEVGRAVDLPVLAAMRPEPRLAAAVEAGRPPGSAPRAPLGRAARIVLSAADRLAGAIR